MHSPSSKVGFVPVSVHCYTERLNVSLVPLVLNTGKVVPNKQG